MNLTICKKLCNECPFSKNSLPGWLGSHTVQGILDSQQFEGLFSCHKVRGENESENEKKILSGEHPICRGYVLSATVSCKVFGQNGKTGKELRRLQNENRPSDEEKELILKRWEFKEHHEKYEVNKD